MRGYLLLKENTPFVCAFIPDEKNPTMWDDYLAEELHSKHKRLSSKGKKKNWKKTANISQTCWKKKHATNR